ncbi:hypothetical protein [Nannocystis pusilla]|uniref:hypothetical protein n=1 Tax=Nannocystis pusilla TaxID=889268 RepID=UPI003B825BFB
MFFGAALAACEPARTPEVRGVRGKRELFGDPALVPTRAGERARRSWRWRTRWSRPCGRSGRTGWRSRCACRGSMIRARWW